MLAVGPKGHGLSIVVLGSPGDGPGVNRELVGRLLFFVLGTDHLAGEAAHKAQFSYI
ncbi:hypothetical protein D3C84_1220650 [compost metagenome]